MYAILTKVCRALKSGGTALLSYKYGEGERETGGRHYSDYTGKDVDGLLKDTGLECIRCFVSGDTLGRTEKWLNIIAKKQAVSYE